ncbi:Mss4-like protein [Gymnopilus junonius]|uniref:Mss4-like protein n=1 Tax=Gymnopilus junonius TaxID=109634 RepID=A0A9P5NFM1_GYMJU|nr:Mss4-like protein [Gymnopilus junonius]
MTTFVDATCQCELLRFRVTFATDSLPITDDLCHCNTCRHTSGQMAVHRVSIQGVPLERFENTSRMPTPGPGNHWQGHANHGTGNANGNSLHPPTILEPFEINIADPEEPLDLNDLIAYKTSKDVTRYFCSSCSAHLFWVHHQPDGDHWAVAVGALERTEGIVKIGYHIWVGDTLDGGMADHLRSIEGVPLKRYKEALGSEELPLGWKDKSILEKKQPDQNKLQAHCHCGKITFDITRPTEASTEPSSPYPDLLCPYDVTHLSKITNPHDEKWWLRPTNSPLPTKYVAGHCMCPFCRRSSGFEVQSWAYIPLVNIVEPGSGMPICLEEESKRPKGLKQYISSPGIYREFCETCGASAFWWRADVLDLVAVSVGLVDEASVGARAEDWLEWQKNRVSYIERAVSRSLGKALEDGLKMA